MNDENTPKMSPLCQSITQNGITVQIDIYENGEGGWVLEVVDHFNASTIWDDAFPTDVAALNEAIRTIDDEGIGSFTNPENNVHH
jgi:hypothetical protein